MHFRQHAHHGAVVAGKEHILKAAAVSSSFGWRVWQPGASKGALERTATEGRCEACAAERPKLPDSPLQMGLISREKSMPEPELERFMFSIKTLLGPLRTSQLLIGLNPKHSVLCSKHRVPWALLPLGAVLL